MSFRLGTWGASVALAVSMSTALSAPKLYLELRSVTSRHDPLGATTSRVRYPLVGQGHRHIRAILRQGTTLGMLVVGLLLGGCIELTLGTELTCGKMQLFDKDPIANAEAIKLGELLRDEYKYGVD